jgi:3alpha(or 20beta)-hydroxysteroid dehydrogenase
MVDIKDDRGTAAATDIGVNARYRHLDVTNEDDWRAVIEDIQAHEGQLDVLVNNAAVLHKTLLDNTSLNTFETVMRVNLTGPFLGTRACLPLMRQSGGGSIVNIGSIDSFEGVPLTVAYTSAKFGLRGLTKVTALENGKFGIRANCVCVAGGSPEMRTEMVGELKVAPPRAPDYQLRIRPIQRTTLIQDIAPVVLFLATEDSRYCTGSELVVDGGLSSGWLYDQPGLFSTSLD